MKALIVYNSIAQGNTEKIARVIAEVLEARLMKASECALETLREFDVVGFGSGIYFEKHHKGLRDMVQRLSDAEGRKAFVFSTSGCGDAKYNKPFVMLVTQKGFNVVGTFTCKGFDNYGFVKHIGGVSKGRPDKNDLERARSFATSIKKKS
jgi:flavodoxin